MYSGVAEDEISPWLSAFDRALVVQRQVIELQAEMNQLRATLVRETKAAAAVRSSTGNDADVKRATQSSGEDGFRYRGACRRRPLLC